MCVVSAHALYSCCLVWGCAFMCFVAPAALRSLYRVQRINWASEGRQKSSNHPPPLAPTPELSLPQPCPALAVDHLKGPALFWFPQARDVRLVQSILYALSAPRHRTVDIVEVASKTTLPFVDVEQAFCSQREGKVHDCTVSTLDAHGHEHTFQIFFFKSERNHINTSVPSDGVWRGEILVMRKGCRRAGYVDIQPSDLARVEGMVNWYERPATFWTYILLTRPKVL
ncbi:hypothetical protein BOTBODRAFT_49427 [Botryobasidium botryosum FD-172 SS1]|uniref:Uncharacterized protein n=1 Tax=Botryobasidium botryosum (strain FD-172 SS1) TaxID=930990 RepID=A0A067LSX8_BOTB1|nr:hypothetical protein BOTBODRAFT_49427 [Botryobasidium botryosum FD-172 SS1]